SPPVRMSFEELEHTADIRIRVKASTIEKLFSDASLALMTVMYGTPGPGNICRHLEMDGEDLVSLLQGFLSELLFISEVEDLVISGAEIRIDGTHLSADLLGEPFSREKHTGGREVKGISYSDLTIAREHDSYILEVIFDV
ncbi:MAG: archease, partial [Methanoregulaceae archaeon]|nr:archease [Methanoregulaceae archaeon]